MLAKYKRKLLKNWQKIRYDDFDDKRKKAEALAADEEDIKELEALEKSLTKKRHLKRD